MALSAFKGVFFQSYQHFFRVELPETFFVLDVDLVFMLESPYQASRNHFSKVLLSGTEFLGDQARSWPPLQVTDFLRGKMQLMMSMVLAKVSEESKVLMCPTAQQSLASAASIHPQCSQERCKAK